MHRTRSAAHAFARTLLLVAALLGGRDVHAQDLLEYGRECATRVGKIPVFDCRQGTLVPITVAGKIPDAYQPGLPCDRPSLLLPSPDQNTDGQCVPHARALVLRDDPQVQISAFCRQKKIRSADTWLYDEIDVIAHNVQTGSTCWFQALTPPPLSPDRGLDGRRVPPPDEATPPPGHPAAVTFWRSPAQTASEHCVRCHDSDPFMYSPFIGQTGQIPRNPFGYYANDVGRVFRKWPKPNSVMVRGNTCIGCHRIGSLTTCATSMYESIGARPSQWEDAWAREFPHSHWMPPGNAQTRVAWEIIYQDSVRQLARCCKEPTAAGCEVRPITGAPPVPARKR
jgi:hypothetical protein